MSRTLFELQECPIRVGRLAVSAKGGRTSEHQLSVLEVWDALEELALGQVEEHQRHWRQQRRSELNLEFAEETPEGSGRSASCPTVAWPKETQRRGNSQKRPGGGDNPECQMPRWRALSGNEKEEHLARN